MSALDRELLVLRGLASCSHDLGCIDEAQRELERLRTRLYAKGAAFILLVLVAASNLPDVICGALGL